MGDFNFQNYLNDLEYLVNIDSYPWYIEGTTKIANFFQERFIDMGWHVKIHHFNPAVGPSLEISNHNKKDNIDILIVGHMDTVFPVGTASDRPFSIKDNKIYGSGVNDMKSGLLNGYNALKMLELEGKLSQASITFAFISDHEMIGSQYSRPWIENLSLNSRYAIGLEAARTDGSLVNQRKGIGRYKIEFNGIAAHSGINHQQGISAINELAHWVIALNNMTNYELGTTVNVGTISGGTTINTVADKAIAEVDTRFWDMNEGKKIEVLMSELMEQPKTLGINTSVNGGIKRPPMVKTDASIELYKKVEEIASHRGLKITWAATGGGADASFPSSLGVPTIDGLGPVGGGSHTKDEYILINSIEPRLYLLKDIIERLIIEK